jgi:N-acetyl sugar amidotransferase
MNYCESCVYPLVAVNLEFQDGLCTACSMARENFSEAIDWDSREQDFVNLAEAAIANSSGNYDCIVPVSGGKDSYYQVHIAKKYGLKPLLVTYHGNNYLPEGDYNRDRMRDVFDVDHLVLGPSVQVLKKMNRLGFKKMGDMNWHAHCGIFTYPMQVAVKFDIPLVLWGEVIWDISGMFSVHDMVEFSNRTRHEHGLRGFEWYDFTGGENEGLADKDLNWAKYPTDDEITNVGLRGVFIGNYFKWDANTHTKLVMDEYGWRAAQQPFERTYRLMSNLDDRYENGIHDLLKFVKFGYGRASDHASKDIRSGIMTRTEGIEMVRKYDHVVSSDLAYWLDYVSMTELEFWQIADTFRDPRVWSIKNGMWVKDTIWGHHEEFGEVFLERDSWSKYQKLE